MSKRKPHDVSWENHIDAQIRRARENGEFENLPGAGKPIPDLRAGHDEMWWLRGLMQREGLDIAPDGLKVRREVEVELARLPRVRTEKALRRRVRELNARIVKANATTTSGPDTGLAPFDEEELVVRWRKARGGSDHS
jgi:DnaJ-like protein